MAKKLKIKFGEVKRGWYPIDVTDGENSVFIDASNIPLDPIIELIAAVENCMIYGQTSEALMHLEPNYYKWKFKPIGNEVVLSIIYIEERSSLTMPGNREERKSLEFEFRGDSKEMLLTFWRCIKEMATRTGLYLNELVQIEKRATEIKKI